MRCTRSDFSLIVCLYSFFLLHILRWPFCISCWLSVASNIYIYILTNAYYFQCIAWYSKQFSASVAALREDDASAVISNGYWYCCFDTFRNYITFSSSPFLSFNERKKALETRCSTWMVKFVPVLMISEGFISSFLRVWIMTNITTCCFSSGRNRYFFFWNKFE